MTATALPTPPSSLPSSGGRLVCLDGRPLALEQTTLRAEARGGLARVVLEQRFRNVHAEALRASYQLPLPADGAVSAFAFRVGARRVVGEVDRRAAARQRYEEALIEGRTAALLEQERSSLFSQEIGNIPPGETVVAEIVIDQKLRWLEEGAFEWRFPTVVAPRYLGAAGVTADAGRVSVDVIDPDGAAPPLPMALQLAVEDALVGGEISSPSHALAVESAPQGGPAGAGPLRWTVRLDGGAARLDRDVVIRWPVASGRPAVSLLTARPADGRPNARDAYGLLSFVPPAPSAHAAAVPRDLIVLLDTSGSMDGMPLAQAKAVVRGLVESLGAADRLEMIEFSIEPRRWQRGATEASPAAKQEALAWLASLEAGGATEMHTGILEALAALRGEAQRQVVLVTDGLISFEEEVVGEILRRLPPATRVHTVGVGSSVNRSLTAAAARAGRGVEVLIGPGEDAAPAVSRLLARTCQPLVTGLEISGSALREHAPAALPDLFAGAPALVSLRLRAEGGSLLVRGRSAGGIVAERIEVAPVAAGQGSPALATRYGRERVEDLEAQAAADGPEAVNAEIERIGLDFQIATRLTSWVAIAEVPSVDPGLPFRRERIPQALAHGLSAEGVGLRRASPQLLMHSLPSASSEDRGDVHVSYSMDPSRIQAFRPPSRRSRLWRGRVVQQKERMLVIEVEGIQALRWEPGAWLSIEIDGGDGIGAVLVPHLSTKPGALKAGVILRLVVETERALGGASPTWLVFENAGDEIRMRLEA